MPMLGEMCTSMPSRRIEGSMSWIARRATASASDCVIGGPSRITNSSPPRRAVVSTERTAFFRRCATSRSSSSPARWPSESFMILNRSRSMTSTDRKSTRLNSSHVEISYAVFCLKKKKKKKKNINKTKKKQENNKEIKKRIGVMEEIMSNKISKNSGGYLNMRKGEWYSITHDLSN